MHLFATVDLSAPGAFVGAWIPYAVAVEWTPHGRDTLNAHMDRYREVWMRRMLHREARMVDMQIMAALQNGTAFFASTSLIAIGGALSLLRSTDAILPVMAGVALRLSAVHSTSPPAAARCRLEPKRSPRRPTPTPPAPPAFPGGPAATSTAAS